MITLVCYIPLTMIYCKVARNAPWNYPIACLNYVSVSYPGAVALFSGFTNGVGQIWLDQVNCRGAETRLADCPANPIGTHDCTHPEDAGVRCSLGKANYIAGAEERGLVKLIGLSIMK